METQDTTSAVLFIYNFYSRVLLCSLQIIAYKLVCQFLNCYKICHCWGWQELKGASCSLLNLAMQIQKIQNAYSAYHSCLGTKFSGHDASICPFTTTSSCKSETCNRFTSSRKLCHVAKKNMSTFNPSQMHFTNELNKYGSEPFRSMLFITTCHVQCKV